MVRVHNELAGLHMKNLRSEIETKTEKCFWRYFLFGIYWFVSVCVFGKQVYPFFSLTCNFTVIGGCLRERAPQGTACCMIISVSAGGKHEQKSLRDREGPHRSPGAFLGCFWTAVIHYSLLLAPHGSFIQAATPWWVLQSQCVTPFLWAQGADTYI